MSELINNREYRRKVLKELIKQLHDGKSAEEVKQKFKEVFGGVAASEIADVERELVAEGLPISEIQRLCDVHAAVFEGSVEEIHRELPMPDAGEHPLDNLRRENRAIEKLIAERVMPAANALLGGGGEKAKADFLDSVQLLYKIDNHYKKKENVLFPFLEKNGINAPPKVMWGVDDEIRDMIKGLRENLTRASLLNTVDKIKEMIVKEENILFPMLGEVMTAEDWKLAAADFSEYEGCLVEYRKPAKLDKAATEAVKTEAAADAAKAKPAEGTVVLPSGAFTMEELTAVLNALPIDFTFVDKEDRVKYFSEGRDRIFVRSNAVLGRQVINCHPPKSYHVVQKILDDLRTGKKDHEDFWIKMGPRYVHIRYFAVRNGEGEFLGTLEVTQDIAPIQEISGEKRLLSE